MKNLLVYTGRPRTVLAFAVGLGAVGLAFAAARIEAVLLDLLEEVDDAIRIP